MIYHFYDLQQAMLGPMRYGATMAKHFYRNPINPLSQTQAGRILSANAEMLERLTRRFGKPEFGILHTKINDKDVTITEDVVFEKPFCNLIHFRRDIKRDDPKVLIVAPMSGHFATLLRGTVAAMLPHHDVYITDWLDARSVPLSDGSFNLDDYIGYLIEFMGMLGPDTHIVAVCQPAVPVFAAVAVMEAEKDPNTPLTMTLMGGPIDPRVSKTKVTELAEDRPLEWFEHSVVTSVPFYYPGAFRKVYPGFIQLGGFMSMNLDRHVGSHLQFYHHLIEGDGDSAEAHRKFYNEYLSVMDIPAEFYLQTVESVFQKHELPQGKMIWHDRATNRKIPVDPKKITKTALLTVEGELDDISALGQTLAAHDLTTNLSPNKKFARIQANVGHYGIFNGRRWRNYIMPNVRHFIRQFDKGRTVIPKADLEKTPDLAPDQWNAEDYQLDNIKAEFKAMREKGAEKDTEKEDA